MQILKDWSSLLGFGVDVLNIFPETTFHFETEVDGCFCRTRSTTASAVSFMDWPRLIKTRPDTRLPKLCAGGQGPCLRSPDHLGRSSEVKEIKS